MLTRSAPLAAFADGRGSAESETGQAPTAAFAAFAEGCGSAGSESEQASPATFAAFAEGRGSISWAELGRRIYGKAGCEGVRGVS